MILHGDCLTQMRKLKPNSVDSIVTDPPYGLSFMGKKWDYDVPSVEIWREALRVLKPGGHLLAFGGTRTYHRLAVNIEDAGFEIRDQIMWLYGSGFPKSMDVSKAIDKAAGAEREVVGIKRDSDGRSRSSEEWAEENADTTFRASKLSNNFETKPATEAAKQWQGWGTALKPANEPIVVARKPLEAKRTVAQNVQKYGTGALNIDASRVGTESITSNAYRSKGKEGCMSLPGEASQAGNVYDTTSHTGRWPANVILDEEAGQALDAQTQHLHASGNKKKGTAVKDGTSMFGIGEGGFGQSTDYGDSGGASRFFYCAKASKRERNAGLEGMPAKKSGVKNDSGRGFSESDPYKEVLNQNFHPTVKPIALMEYLIRLVTPPRGTVLDPFMGSGSTGVAARRLKMKFTGIELNPEYAVIAERRIEATA